MYAAYPLKYIRVPSHNKTQRSMDLFKGLIMDGCVLLTSTPECV